MIEQTSKEISSIEDQQNWKITNLFVDLTWLMRGIPDASYTDILDIVYKYTIQSSPPPSFSLLPRPPAAPTYDNGPPGAGKSDEEKEVKEKARKKKSNRKTSGKLPK